MYNILYINIKDNFALIYYIFFFQINQLRNQHRISVTGNRIPKPITNFTELSTTYDVSSKLINNIINCGYECPTPIQMQAIPAMLQVRLSHLLLKFYLH